ncbi:MAG: ISNCY family transposase, partial [Acidobacteria bacterium]|nr:ISNCY family transposase [Acidobacteriota bacterium]
MAVLGDDLYCHEPFCRDLLAQGSEFILVCKPDSHPLLYEWVEFLERSGSVKTLVRKRWTGKRHEIDTYRYVGAVPLRDGDDALVVNWCELTTTTLDSQVVYHNAFATSHAVEDANVVEVVGPPGAAGGRFENENNNTLKTKGYHFEHKYGHGQQFLSSLLATLILLAYGLHTLLEWMDDKYRLLRQKLPSRQRLFNDI